MHVDPRLNNIDDCLYRVATRAIIVQDHKVLMVKEIPEHWWGFPGGGVDHGEDVNTGLVREVEEEIGVPLHKISSDFEIIHYSIGTIVNKIPRMNLFFRVNVPKELVIATDHVGGIEWFSKAKFMKLRMSPSYKDRVKLAQVIFDK